MTLEVVFAPIIADLAVEFSTGQEFSACLETGQDLEVEKIPIYAVSNTAGGTTVTIG